MTSEIGEQSGRFHVFGLIIALIIAANADFPFVMTRDESEIGRREDERNRPPDGSEEKTVWAGCDSVSRQRILGR